MILAFSAIFAVSLALLTNEIMLSAIFHVLIGAGNTVAAIAIALIGLSASGVVAYFAPPLRDPERARALYPSLLLWFTIVLIASSFAMMSIPLSHGDLVYHASEPGVRFARLLVYQITVLPFFMGGLVINAILRTHAEAISRLYFMDLAGAALGCLASPLLLGWIGAPRAILWAGLPALVVAAIAAYRGERVSRFAFALPVLLIAASLALPGLHSFQRLNTMGEVDAPAYRGFPIGRGDIDYERWGLDAWTIIRSDRIPQQWENFRGWALSPTYDGPVPEIKLVNYNARFSTYVTRYEGDTSPLGPWIDADLSSLHQRIGRDYARVLNIGAGGGREVLGALHHGAEHVDAVDISDIVVDDIMRGRLREWSGELYFDPRVNAVADEGRSFTERSDGDYDLIEFSIVGGMNLEKMDLVRIDDLFTLEALCTYVSKLDEEGSFSYVMYTTRSDQVDEMAKAEFLSSHPYIPGVRTLAGLRIAFEESVPGMRFEDHVLVAAMRGIISPNYDLVHIVASKKPFSASERRRFLELSRELEFLALYPRPATGPPDASVANLYERVAQAADLEQLSASLPFGVTPSTDDRPFQYAFDASHLRRALERGKLLDMLTGNPLVSLGVSISLLALAVTLAPLLWFTRKGGAPLADLWACGPLLAAFAGLGFGYMAIEIAALLRLQLYLGKPIYGLSVGLFAFLISSALGSRFTERYSHEALPAAAYRGALFVIVMGIVFLLFAGPLFSSTMSLPLGVRILVATAAVFPVAFPMGMFFPICIKLLSSRTETMIPWAWAINGCFSVLGIFGTRIAALFVGFDRALVMGLASYLVVAACVYIFARKAPIGAPELRRSQTPELVG